MSRALILLLCFAQMINILPEHCHYYFYFVALFYTAFNDYFPEWINSHAQSLSPLGSSGAQSGLQLSAHLEARIRFENDGLDQLFLDTVGGYLKLVGLIRSLGASDIAGSVDLIFGLLAS